MRYEIMNCIQCTREFLKDERVASISGSIMGDEYTDVYYLCPVCRVYTVANWRDSFTGNETMTLSGPMADHEGHARVELIKTCSRAWDKKCRCEAHRDYFNNALD